MDQDKITSIIRDYTATLLAFTELLTDYFGELLSHAAHHVSDDQLEELDSLLEGFTRYMAEAKLTPMEVVTTLRSLMSATQGDEAEPDARVSVIELPLGDGTVEDAIKARLNSDPNEEVAAVLETLLSTGTVDQIDAELRDQRNSQLN